MIGPKAWLDRYVEGEPSAPVASMFGINFLDELDNSTYTWLAPVILADFGKGVGTGGVIFVLASVIAPIFALPVARRADRSLRMPLVIGAAVVWGIFSILTGAAPDLLILIAARVGSSFGRTVSYPVAAGLMVDYYSPRVRNKAMGVFTAASQAGDFIGPGLGAGMAAIFGWRGAFVFIAVVSVPILLASSRVKDPVRGAYDPPIEVVEEVPWREAFDRLWAIRSMRRAFTAGIWIGAGVIGSKFILSFFFKDDFNVGTFGLGIIGSIAGGGALVTTIYGATLSQKALDVSPANAVFWLCRIGFAITVLTVAFALSPDVYVAVPILFVISCLAGVVAPMLLTLVGILSPPELRSRAQALAGVIALAAVLPVGVLAAVAEVAGDRAAIVLSGLCILRGTIVVRSAARFINDDVARLSGELPGGSSEALPISSSDLPAGGRGVGDAVLRTRGVTVSYDGTQVLFGVDLEVGRGEIVALLGTNGAGKSTILNAVCGLVGTDSGGIFFDGADITGLPAESIAKRGLIMAPGGRGIFPGLTVAENLRLGAYLLRKDRPLSASRVAGALEVFPALKPMLDIAAGSLSGGQRQMLVLAQAFLLRPKLLLIDELSLGLAPVIVSDLLDAVRRLNAEGIAVVLVEQSVNVALTLADRAYFLEKGQVRFSGPTADLLGREDLLRSVFLRGAGAAV